MIIGHSYYMDVAVDTRQWTYLFQQGQNTHIRTGWH